jgi:hypothetical protein
MVRPGAMVRCSLKFEGMGNTAIELVEIRERNTFVPSI